MPLAEASRMRLAEAGTSAVSDAMERLLLPRSVITGFRVHRMDSAVVGSALTVRQVPKHFPAQKTQRLVRHDEVSRELAQPGDFVVVDLGGRTDIAGWGENHSRRCHDRGVSGALINGSTRDVAGIRALGFPVFHLGASPVSSRWDLETAEINGPVVVAGVTVRAGDVIVADEDGVIVMAPELVEQILESMK